MKQHIALSLLSAAIVGVWAESGVAQPAGKLTGDTLKIGVLTDMSGPYADPTGQGSVIAAQMAVEEFGGKIFGKPIQIISADHQNKADIGSARVREWFDRDGVDMVTDVPNSGVAIAVSKLANEKQRVFLAVGPASTRLTNEDCNPYTVHWMYDTYALANGTADAVVQMGGTSWFFVTADYAFGHSLEKDASEVVKARGGNVLGQVRHPLNTPDFSSFMLQAQASKAKIIGLANAGGDTINAIKSAAEFKLTKDQSLAGLLVNLTDIHSLGLKTAQGLLVTEGFYWDLNDSARAFGRKFFEKAKKMPSMIHAGVYSATLNYLRAVEKAGIDDGPAVMAQLKKMRIKDAAVEDGWIREDGRLMKKMYLLQVKKPGDSTQPWDYYKLVSTIKEEQAFQPLSKSRCPFVKK